MGLLESVKDRWPWMTKSRHDQLMQEQYSEHKLQVDRLLKSHAERIIETEAMVDEVIRKLTFFKIERSNEPPYEQFLQFSLDPDIVMMLRDPGLGGGSSVKRVHVFNLIRSRISYLISNAFMLNIPHRAGKWENP